MKDDSTTRCKKCGKVIVGKSRLGLCDSCFNSDATKTVGTLGALALLIKPVIKPIGKAITNALKNALKNK